MNFTLLSQSLQGFLRHLDHDEFKATMLPAMLKGMLRNPETAAKICGMIISRLNLDLSRYSAEVIVCLG